LQQQHCSVPKHIATLLDAPVSELPAPEKAAFLERLLPYLYPQRKPIDPEGYLTVEQAVQMQRSLLALFRQALLTHIPEAATIDRILADLRPSQGNGADARAGGGRP
jgi:hypothetical protein